MSNSTSTALREVLVAHGYGLRIAVERGHLLIEDGIGDERRSRTIPRVSPLKRVVVVGHTGSVTLDALRWLRDVKAGFVQVDADASVIAVGTPSTLDDVRVRRGQAFAMGNRVGIEVARALLVAKLKGQAEVLRRIPQRADARKTVETAAKELATADSIASLRYVESRAAAAYWDAWQDVTTRFPAREATRAPEHWLRFGTRSSLLNDSPRKATSPVNALLNYLYAILEAEARIAIAQVGCDAGMGVIHSDRPSRDSFAFDLMEPVRPEIDRYVLELLDSRTFLRSDFFETREGVCRLMPKIAEPLAATAPQWAKALGPLAEWCAAQFASGTIAAPAVSSRARPASAQRFRTPITHANSSRPATLMHRAARPQAAEAAAVPVRCRDCGVDLGNRKRTYCDSCLPEHAARASAKGVETQRQLRAIGEDKRSSLQVRAKHSAAAHKQHRLNSAWEAKQHTIPSRAVFRREILPTLRNVAVAALTRASGLSTDSCKKIRNGTFVPHPRHWDAFRRVRA
jgi:CRISPR-associated endonuclease Cas1